jgi:hypothetical protein
MSVRLLASALLLLAACSGDGGAPLERSNARRESPGPTGRENPGSTRELPGSTRGDDPGTTGTPGACLDCGQAYQCDFGQDTIRVHLEQTSSGCTLTGLLLRCDGKVLQEGQVVAEWREDAGGNLTLIVNGVQYGCVPTEATTDGNGRQG